MANTPSSYTLSEYTKRQIRELAETHKLTQSTVLTLAVDRMYSQTLGDHAEYDPMIDHAKAQEAHHADAN
jgi:hypothetical protein